MKTVKVGIIGCGHLGRTHAECVGQLEGAYLSAYCDVFEENAIKLLEKFGGDYATSDVQRLLDDTSIDALYITTLHDSHAELSIQALNAGKHVLVEKPLSMSLEDCLRIGEAVTRSRKKLFTAFKMRYFDMLWKAKELIPEPLVVTMQMMDNRWPDNMWANDPVKGGGNVISQGCHSTDIMRYVAGSEPVEVYAAGGNYYQPTGVVDNLVAVYRFANGAAGNLVQGDCRCPEQTSKFFMQLFAKDKSITICDRLTTLTYQEDGEPTVVYKGSESGFLEENRAFLQCIREDTPPLINHVDGLYATLMILQAIASLQSGKPEPIQAVVEQALSGSTQAV
ncbi:Gfo/Idh/MocA family protein [Paenibacillus cymbidii]|uniref:Gfo/Idh/MocA family protein n=1 Tax=Paenibacillus cymbidii TaxID=1639034 RepID=UPI0010812FAC|nr:Gfo/Idh/MocA family oxidoreductase [Paenibacillus cymbidii]